jgi:hypothetical protein
VGRAAKASGNHRQQVRFILHTHSAAPGLNLQKGHGEIMKIVVFRSPAFLAPFLRRFFGIRKNKKK